MHIRFLVAIGAREGEEDETEFTLVLFFFFLVGLDMKKR